MAKTKQVKSLQKELSRARQKLLSVQITAKQNTKVAWKNLNNKRRNKEQFTQKDILFKTKHKIIYAYILQF